MSLIMPEVEKQTHKILSKTRKTRFVIYCFVSAIYSICVRVGGHWGKHSELV